VSVPALASRVSDSVVVAFAKIVDAYLREENRYAEANDIQ